MFIRNSIKTDGERAYPVVKEEGGWREGRRKGRRVGESDEELEEEREGGCSIIV